MKKMILFFTTILTMMILSTVAFATEIAQVPEVEIFSKLAELILNWGAMGSLAKGMIIVTIAVQAIKQISDFKYKNLLVSILSVAYGIFQVMVNDVSFGSAFVTVLVSGGGAIVIYNAAKPFLKSIPFLKFLNLGSK